MGQRLIELVGLDPTLRTAYVRGGRTRSPSGQVPPLRDALTIGRAPSKNWRLTKASAASLLEVVEAIANDGGEPLRLVDAFRDPKTQAYAREQYDNWVKAGKPEPGSARFHRGTMKTAYVANPGQSNHGWGASIDIDVGALLFPGLARGSDEALAKLWEIMAQHGWSPVIQHPIAAQAEAWHFDHLGPLQVVYDLFREHRVGGAYGHTATVGSALAGTLLRSDRSDWIYIQSRVTLAGQYIGLPDGIPGRKTKAGLKALGIPATVVKRGAHATAAELNRLQVAEDLIEAA